MSGQERQEVSLERLREITQEEIFDGSLEEQAGENIGGSVIVKPNLGRHTNGHNAFLVVDSVYRGTDRENS